MLEKFLFTLSVMIILFFAAAVGAVIAKEIRNAIKNSSRNKKAKPELKPVDKAPYTVHPDCFMYVDSKGMLHEDLVPI